MGGNELAALAEMLWVVRKVLGSDDLWMLGLSESIHGLRGRVCGLGHCMQQLRAWFLKSELSQVQIMAPSLTRLYLVKLSLSSHICKMRIWSLPHWDTVRDKSQHI